jgi:hypothetical protein
MEPVITSLLSAGTASSLVPLLRTVFGRRRGGQLLEQLVIEALAMEAGAAGAPVARETSGPFDARMPDGMRELPGPVAVDIWVSSRIEVSGAELAERLERDRGVAAQQGFRSLLLAASARIPEQARTAVTSSADAFPTRVLDATDLARLFRTHGEQLAQRLPDLALAPLRAALQAPEADWQAESRARQLQLRSTYRQRGLVLVLGAGVSIGMGLPNWDELISGLFVSLVTRQLQGRLDEDQAFAVAEAARHLGNESPLLSARYLRRGIEDGNAGDPGTFQRELAVALYRRVGAAPATPPLLYELAKLCVPLRTGPKVHSVITYNFDDMLEQVLTGDGVAHRSVWSGRQHPSELELPVFHAHGFLPRDVEGVAGLDEGLLAFSEEGYHQLFRDPYHWANVMQLRAFQQETCLFVGLSLTDPNLRRLLEYATAGHDDPRHYVFMRRSSVKDVLAAAPPAPDGPSLTPDAAEDFLKVHHTLQERVLRELGLQVVWFDGYEDMPAAVRALRD